MATVNDLILEELRTLKVEMKTIGEDVAVLKSKHDNGNRSERIAAWCSIVAVLVSVAAIFYANKANAQEPVNETDSIHYRDHINMRLHNDPIQPEKTDLPN